MIDMKSPKLIDGFFSQMGLERNKEYLLREIIKSLMDREITILSVLGEFAFPSDFNPDIAAIVNTNFKRKFYGSVFYDDKEDLDSFEALTEILNANDKFELTRIEISGKDFFYRDKSGEITRNILITIKGNSSELEGVTLITISESI
jgi:hypothetical protein